MPRKPRFFLADVPAHIVRDEHYLLTCMRYIELNPVRADMVKSPAHHRWSSYRSNAQGKDNPLVAIHPEYKRLGSNSAQRCAAYRELFKGHVEAEELNDIRSAWQTGTPLGNDRFRDKIEETLKYKVGYSQRGRPKRLEPGLILIRYHLKGFDPFFLRNNCNEVGVYCENILFSFIVCIGWV